MKSAILHTNNNTLSNLDKVELYLHNLWKDTPTLQAKKLMEKLASNLLMWKKINEVKVVTLKDYYKHPDYIKSMIEHFQKTLGSEDPSEYELVFLAHGSQQKTIDKGDEYQRHIKYNVFHARKALVYAGIDFYKSHLAYESNVEEKLKRLDKKKVILYPISYTIDASKSQPKLDEKYNAMTQNLGLEKFNIVKSKSGHPTFLKYITTLYKDIKHSENKKV
jgi:protoporphyrin/coproporphyrin ferrochelatase